MGIEARRCSSGVRARPRCRSACPGTAWKAEFRRSAGSSAHGKVTSAASPAGFSPPTGQWLAIQRELLSEQDRSSARARVAAHQAWALLVEDSSGELHLEPSHLAALLELAAICPAFSRELFSAEGSFGDLFCSEEAFDGSTDRQQYFRNQFVALASEKAEVIAEALAAFERTSDEDLDEALAWNAVCNMLTEEEPPTSLFLLESEKAPELGAYQKGDVFFLRRRAQPLYPVACVPAPAAQSLTTDSATALGDGLARVALAIVTAIKTPSDSRVSLLGVTAHQLTSSGDMGAACGEEYQVVPSNFLPTVLKRRQAAILDLCGLSPGYSSLVQQLVFGEVTPELLAPPDSFMKLPAAAVKYPHLNSSQRRAVEAAASRTITLVEGPPGTGKTDVAVAIIQTWLAQDLDTPILVATGTHIAKDLLARRLQAQGLKPSLRSDVLLRRPHPPDAVPVFVETVYMAAVPTDRELPRVIIDESSQIAESAALVAMGRQCRQLVLIGDPKQLGPVSVLGLAGPDRAPLAKERSSVFERALERHPLLHEGCVQLDLQYRMHPAICKYPSMRFYCDALRKPHGSCCAAACPS